MVNPTSSSSDSSPELFRRAEELKQKPAGSASDKPTLPKGLMKELQNRQHGDAAAAPSSRRRRTRKTRVLRDDSSDSGVAASAAGTRRRPQLADRRAGVSAKSLLAGQYHSAGDSRTGETLRERRQRATLGAKETRDLMALRKNNPLPQGAKLFERAGVDKAPTADEIRAAQTQIGRLTDELKQSEKETIFRLRTLLDMITKAPTGPIFMAHVIRSLGSLPAGKYNNDMTGFEDQLAPISTFMEKLELLIATADSMNIDQLVDDAINLGDIYAMRELADYWDKTSTAAKLYHNVRGFFENPPITNGQHGPAPMSVTLTRDGGSPGSYDLVSLVMQLPQRTPRVKMMFEDILKLKETTLYGAHRTAHQAHSLFYEAIQGISSDSSDETTTTRQIARATLEIKKSLRLLKKVRIKESLSSSGGNPQDAYGEFQPKLDTIEASINDIKNAELLSTLLVAAGLVMAREGSYYHPLFQQIFVDKLEQYDYTKKKHDDRLKEDKRRVFMAVSAALQMWSTRAQEFLAQESDHSSNSDSSDDDAASSTSSDDDVDG